MNGMIVKGGTVVAHCAFLKHDTYLNLCCPSLFGNALSDIAICISDFQLPLVIFIIDGIGIDFRRQ